MFSPETGIMEIAMASSKAQPTYQILWIERRRVKVPTFVPALRKRGHEVHVVHSGKAAVEWLRTFTPDLVVLYAASFGTSGCRTAKLLRQAAADTPILLIASPEAPPKPQAPVDYTLTLPFTNRKLLNRIRRLLPGDERKWHRVGKVAFDERRRVVRCQGRETRLTPRVAKLLRYFMEHPNQIVPYHTLFSDVWHTTYLGDIRTLQVHISWLRKALETDPKRPQFLETLRGVGYRFHPNGKDGGSS